MTDTINNHQQPSTTITKPLRSLSEAHTGSVTAFLHQAAPNLTIDSMNQQMAYTGSTNAVMDVVN